MCVYVYGMDFNFKSRLQGRSLLRQLNNHTVFSLFIIGGASSLFLLSLILSILNINFLLICIVSWLIMRHFHNYIKKINYLNNNIYSELYPVNCNQHVWDTERTRDKLMFMLLQAGICPWSIDRKCKGNECACGTQRKELINMGFDINKPVILNEEDSQT